MAVDVTNIIVGSGTLKVGSTEANLKDMGGTREGVQMAREADYLDVTADQYKAVLKKYLISEKRYVRTSLLEPTLENIQFIWGGEVTTEGNTKTLKMAANVDPVEYVLQFTGPGVNGATRTYTNTRAVQVGTGEHTYQKEGEVLLPADFEILADPKAEPGEEWGTIVEEAIVEDPPETQG